MCFSNWLRAVTVVVGCGLVLPLVGCSGGSGVAVEGKVLVNGQPYKVADAEQLQITFLGTGADGKGISASANYDASTSSLTVSGPTGKGIPPGSYKIAVSSSTYGPKQTDRLRGMFEADRTPLAYNVTTDPVQNIVIDLGRRTVNVQ
jgi:hypothetical protein